MYFVIAIVDIHATVATSAVVVVYVSAIAAAVVIKPLAGFISACAFSLKIYSVSSQVVGSLKKPEQALVCKLLPLEYLFTLMRPPLLPVLKI